MPMMETRRVSPQVQRSEIIIIVPEASGSADKDAEKATDEGPLLEAISPFINSMRFFGLFFLKENGRGGDNNRTRGSRCRPTFLKFSSPLHAFAFAVLVAMWLNTIRLVTIFYPSDDGIESDIIGKCVTFIWTLMCTLVQTSCYRTCDSGRIIKLFRIFGKKLTPTSLKFIRRKVLLYTLIGWQLWTVNVVFFAYVLFFSSQKAMDNLLAPYNTVIHLDPKTAPLLQCLYMIIHVYVNGAHIFPSASNLLLARILSNEFNSNNSKFRRAIENADSFKDSFEDLRRRHQMLSRLVSKADKFMCFSNAVYVLGLIFLVIANLYNLIWSSWLPIRPLPTFLALEVFWLSWGLFSLGVVSFGGVLVNHSAHKIYERMHDIDLTKLNAETIGKINTFLNRLTGEPIGFTVLGIFVIDRNAILTIIGLLITYFLLIVQLVPPSSEHSHATTEPMTTSGNDIQDVMNRLHL